MSFSDYCHQTGAAIQDGKSFRTMLKIITTTTNYSLYQKTYLYDSFLPLSRTHWWWQTDLKKTQRFEYVHSGVDQGQLKANAHARARVSVTMTLNSNHGETLLDIRKLAYLHSRRAKHIKQSGCLEWTRQGLLGYEGIRISRCILTLLLLGSHGWVIILTTTRTCGYY